MIIGVVFMMSAVFNIGLDYLEQFTKSMFVALFFFLGYAFIKIDELEKKK